MVYYLRTILLIAILLFPVAASAGHPLSVEDTATEGKGNFLLELTGDYLKSSEFKTTKWTGIVTAGTGEHTEVSLEAPYLLLHQNLADQDVSGKGDARLKMKGRLFENEVKQSMAYLFFIDLPTGDLAKGLGTNNVVWGVKLIDSQECRNCIFHVNLGYEVFGRDLRRTHFAENYAVTFGFAAGHRFTNSFRVLTELAGEIRKEKGQSLKPFTLLGGIVYDITRSWYVDLGARAGLNKDAEDYTVLAGTGWRF